MLLNSKPQSFVEKNETIQFYVNDLYFTFFFIYLFQTINTVS